MSLYTALGLLFIPLSSVAGSMKYHTAAIALASVAVALCLVGLIETFTS